MHCTNCGNPLSESANFCRSCGIPTPRRPAPPAWVGATQASAKKSTRFLKFAVLGGAGLVVLGAGLLLVGVLAYRYFSPTDDKRIPAGAQGISGQMYANRAVTIGGDQFGELDVRTTAVTIGGTPAPIVTWEPTQVRVIVPPTIEAGDKDIVLSNPPVFERKTLRVKFSQQAKSELARLIISPAKETVLRHKAFTLIVPAGSVSSPKELLVSRYQAPCPDDTPYHLVREEYEVTDAAGEHVFFDRPVLIGFDVPNEEEALSTDIQIFDNTLGIWARSETIYNRADGRLYAQTQHFSSVRTLAWRFAGEYAKALKKIGSYPIDFGKYALRKGRSVAVSVGTFIADQTVEKFGTVEGDGTHVIVYYRWSDAANDETIPDKAVEMAAAFTYAYERYRDVFGPSGVPSTRTLVYGGQSRDFVREYQERLRTRTVPTSELVGTGQWELKATPIKVYIDPHYNVDGANFSIVTGNISMPSVYPKGNLKLTCAHELFHAVQYHQIKLKMAYMGNGLTQSDSETQKIFANDKWFLEATAEHAGLFIGTGIGLPVLYDGTEATLPHYAFNGIHPYGMASFLDYIVTSRNTRTSPEQRDSGFRDLWRSTTGNYGLRSNINSALRSHTEDELKATPQALYEDFWKEAATMSKMPELQAGDLGRGDIKNLARATRNALTIREGGVGLFRVNVSPSSMIKDPTALTRSLWFETSGTRRMGHVFRLPGMAMKDRLSDEPKPIGYVNPDNPGRKKALVPFRNGESYALIACFTGNVKAVEQMRLDVKATSIVWDNQKEIQTKLDRATLTRNDALSFTPVLPKLENDEQPFSAIVILNESADYRTKIDRLEPGKSFKVAPPMHANAKLPPTAIAVNITVYRERQLVHEYQSGELPEEVLVDIAGGDRVYELTDGVTSIDHNFTGNTTKPQNEFRFEWNYGDKSPRQSARGRSSTVKHTYKSPGKYTAVVTLYDSKDRTLSTDQVVIELKTKKDESSSGEPDPPAISSPQAQEYAWVLTGTRTNDWKSRLAANNAKSKGWKWDVSASAGSATIKTTYVGGKNDLWMKNGMSESGTVTWTPPSSSRIKPGDKVSVDLTATNAPRDHSNFFGIISTSVKVWRLKEDGSRAGGPVTYFSDDSGLEVLGAGKGRAPTHTVKATVSGKLPAGREGQRLGICVTANGGGQLVETLYVYEWKKQ